MKYKDIEEYNKLVTELERDVSIYNEQVEIFNSGNFEYKSYEQALGLKEELEEQWIKLMKRREELQGLR